MRTTAHLEDLAGLLLKYSVRLASLSIFLDMTTQGIGRGLGYLGQFQRLAVHRHKVARDVRDKNRNLLADAVKVGARGVTPLCQKTVVVTHAKRHFAGRWPVRGNVTLHLRHELLNRTDITDRGRAEVGRVSPQGVIDNMSVGVNKTGEQRLST